MKKKARVFLPLLLVALLLLFRLPDQLSGAADPTAQSQNFIETLTQTLGQEAAPKPETATLDENGEYSTAEDVALYLHLFGHLPPNYITKKEAEALGWNGGSLAKIAPGRMLGDTYFGNYEGLLPAAKGRSWHECDVNNLGAKSRGPDRLVYSNDGLVYFTNDHYESFELLYGTP